MYIYYILLHVFIDHVYLQAKHWPAGEAGDPGGAEKEVQEGDLKTLYTLEKPRFLLLLIPFDIRCLLRSVRSTGRSSLTAVPRLAATPFGR